MLRPRRVLQIARGVKPEALLPGLIVALLFGLASPGAARAEDLQGLRLLVPDVRGQARWGTANLTRGIVQELETGGYTVLQEDAFAEAGDTLRIDPKVRWNPKALAVIGKKIDAHWVLRVTVTKRGWLYTARALLVNTESGQIEMDFRSDYYKPDTETRDRGYRIGRKTNQKLETLWPPRRAQLANVTKPPEPPPPSDTTETTTVAESTSILDEVDTDTDFGSDSDFDAEFNAEFSGDTEVTAEAEFDGFGEEDGWVWSVRGWVGSKYWAFVSPDLLDGKSRQILKAGFRSTVTGKFGDSARVRLLPLVEVDATNQRLHRLIVEEAFFEYGFRHADVRIGWNTLTWGSASALHVVDVINARNFAEGIVDAPKVGQPMASAKFLLGNHSLSLLYLTPFIPPALPRFDTPFSVIQAPTGQDPQTFDYGDAPLYASSLEQWHPQVATRLDLVFSGFDVHAGYFYGYNRFPFVHLPTDTLVYPLLHHISSDASILFGNTSLKLEGAYVIHTPTDRTRNPPLTLDNGRPAAEIPMPGPRVMVVAGVEHTFDNFVGGSTFIPLAEVIGDSDSQLFGGDRPPDDIVRFFENHVVYGFRWDFNNGVGSQITFTDLFDLRNPTDHLITLEYNERWFQHYTFAIGGRLGTARDGTKGTFFRQLTSLYTELRLNY